jgi:hypothetical protein
MDADQRALTRRLFSVATMIASEAEELAVEGQSPKLSARQYQASARQLLKRTEDLTRVAQAIEAAIRY